MDTDNSCSFQLMPLKRHRRVGIVEVRRSISEHLYYMTKKSSFHGVSYMADRSHPLRRLVWFLTTGLALAYCATKVYESTVEYLKYVYGDQFVSLINNYGVSRNFLI